MFSDPVKNLRALGLHESDIVADLGAGTGYYALAAAHIVTRGKVYAVEIEKEFLHTIKNKTKEAHLSNVEIIWGNVEKIGGTKIGDSITDAVIASNILFQIEHKDSFVEEIKRILKPKGPVLLVDWSSDSPLMGAKHAVPQAKAREIYEKKGFLWQRDINTGEHHYGMILSKL